MKSSGGAPILKLDLPGGYPKQVQKARESFDHVATEVARLHGEKNDTRQALELAKKEDRRDYAAALAKDFDALPKTEHEDAVKAQAAEIAAKLPILEGLADEAGNALVYAVGDALDAGWREELQAAQAETAARVDALVEEFGAALAAYGKAKAAAEWAAKFDVSAALTPGWHRVPDVQYRPGKPVVVPVPSNANAPRVNGMPQVPVAQVVEALRRVTKEPEAPRGAVTNEPAIVLPANHA